MSDSKTPCKLDDAALDAATGGHRATSHRRIQPVQLMKRIDQTTPLIEDDTATHEETFTTGSCTHL